MSCIFMARNLAPYKTLLAFFNHTQYASQVITQLTHARERNQNTRICDAVKPLVLKPKEEYFDITMSILCLLMPWLLPSPSHQQTWHWLHKMHRTLSFVKNDFDKLINLGIDDILAQVEIIVFFLKYIQHHQVNKTIDKISNYTPPRLMLLQY